MKKILIAFAVVTFLIGGVIETPKAQAFGAGEVISLLGIAVGDKNHDEYMNEIMLEEVSNGYRVWSHRKFTAIVPFGYSVEYLKISENREIKLTYAKAGEKIVTNSLIFKSVGLADRPAKQIELNATQLYNLSLQRMPDGSSVWEENELVEIEIPKGITVYYWGRDGARFHINQTGGIIKAFRLIIYDKSGIGK